MLGNRKRVVNEGDELGTSDHVKVINADGYKCARTWRQFHLTIPSKF